MRKIFSSLVLIAALLISNVTFAAFEETITEGANIGAVKRLAVNLPMHYKVEETEPGLNDFTSMIFNASKVARCYVISYDEIADNIKRETNTDIKTLDDNAARRVFDENIAKYADAYLVVTTANNSKRTQFFFDVIDAKTGEMLYRLTSQSSDFGKDLKGYNKACEAFYKKFDAAAAKSVKDNEKKSKD